MNKSNTTALTSRKPLSSSSSITDHFPLVNQGGRSPGRDESHTVANSHQMQLATELVMGTETYAKQ